MLYGPTLIKICQHCQGLIEELTLDSGNTIRARCWTDGKLHAPMLPDTPRLVKCPHCAAMLWLEELPLKQEVYMPHAIPGAQAYMAPTYSDLIALLNAVALTPEKERYVRIRTWWAGNDRRRDTEIMSTLSTQEKQNLEALKPLLALSNTEGRLMLAEIHRELGAFQEVETMCVQDLAGDYAHVALTIADLAEKHDPYVREIELENRRLGMPQE